MAYNSPQGVHAGNDPAMRDGCECGKEPCVCPHPIGCGCYRCECDRADHEYHRRVEDDLYT
jgi:hypothetical protein